MSYLNILRKKLHELLTREDGASAIEYSIIAALIAVVIVGAVTNVGTEINTIFGEILTGLQGR